MTKTRILIPALTLLTLALVSSPAGATPLLPGGIVVPSLSSGSPGTLIASVTQPFTSVLGLSDFGGFVHENVYREAGGTLDFLYQFSNSALSGQSINVMSASLYQGFTTNVQNDVSGSYDGFSASPFFPFLASRDSSGNPVDWIFNSPQLAPGQVSSIMLIRTNAKAFGPGTVSFIDDGTVTVGQMFAPATAVTTTPEPDALVLLGTGLIGLFGISRKRLGA